MEEQNQVDLLQDIKDDVNYVDPVSQGVRFVNFIIDRIAVLSVVYNIRYIWNIISPGAVERFDEYLAKQDVLTIWLIEMAVSMSCVFFYYTLFEASTKGRTLGKLFTGTTAITQDGTPFTFKHALLRTLCRLIPFETFSGLAYMPWHDTLTKTAVVKKTW
jgi:uncharacterized RDD family membrane protein YckC